MAARSRRASAKPELVRRFRKACSADLYKGDALVFLRSLRSGSAHLVFLDPPFNLGKRYGRGSNDRMAADKYRVWMLEVLAEAIRVLAPGGALYLYHLPSRAVELAPRIGQDLVFRHWIAISMKNGFVRGERLYPAHYALLFYTKGKPLVFNRPKLSLEYCDCGRTRKSYGGYLSIVQEKGLNLSDFWEDVSPVRHRARKRRRANELPSRVTDRVVAISGKKDLLFVDPFAGGGSAVLAALRAGMQVKACDVVRANASLLAHAVETMSPKESR